MAEKLKFENLVSALKIQTLDTKSFENFNISAGKRLLVRFKPYVTKDDYYEGQDINGVLSLDFEIKIIEVHNYRVKVEINNAFYWIEKNRIFNWSERTRRQGWVIVDELPTEQKS